MFIIARRVTNETFRWVSDARFHPSGSKIIASKWYTGWVTLAASEVWEYDLPSFDDIAPILPQSGRRLLGRTLPAGMTLDDYADSQVGSEQASWLTTDTFVFAKNTRDPYYIAADKGTPK